MTRGVKGSGDAAKASRETEEMRKNREQWERTLREAPESSLRYILEITAQQLQEHTEAFVKASKSLSDRIQEVNAAILKRQEKEPGA